MPFTRSDREKILVRSRRACCVCHQQAGRDLVVHHIQAEAEGGSNQIENGIALCPHCHAEAGHYNPQHPIGTKYSPSELIQHRNEWWEYCKRYSPSARPKGFREPVASARAPDIHEKRVGTPWSLRADISQETEVIRFRGRLLAKNRHETIQSISWRELYALPAGRYLVYEEINHRGDYGTAWLHGVAALGQTAKPLAVDDVQERFPDLATLAGLERVRELDGV